MNVRRIISCFLVILLSATIGNAGPLTDAVAKAAQTTPPANAPAGKNKMLWPGVGLMAAGGLIALYGFNTASGAEIKTNVTGTSTSVSVKRNTGVAVTGLGIAGLGGFLLYKGANDAKRQSIAVGPKGVTYKVRF